MPCASLPTYLKTLASLRKCVLLAVFFLLPTPAPACHIYSVWHYKTPQHCGVALAQVTPRVIPQARIEAPKTRARMCRRRPLHPITPIGTHSQNYRCCYAGAPLSAITFL